MTLLTICIPTYNRAPFLEECIASLIPEVEAHGISICVADNGSTDETRAVVERLRATRYPLIRYTASATNDRIDRNIVRAAAMAETRYAWFFGDDDRIAPGSMHGLLAVLATGPAVVYVNRSEWSTGMSRRLLERTVPLQADLVIDDPDVLLGEFAWYITFVGALVVDAARWKAIDHAPYLDTDFVHVGIVHEYFVPGDRAVIHAAPLIECRIGNASWSNRYFDVWFLNWPATLFRLPARYGRPARIRAIRRMIDASILTLFSARAAGKFDSRRHREIIAPLYEFVSWRRAVARLISVVPVSVARLITSSQRGVRGWWRDRSSDLRSSGASPPTR